MNELHPVQRQIVELLDRLGVANFNKLKPAQVDPHLFVYHLEKLLQAGVIERTPEGLYQFTEQGRHAVASLHQGIGLHDAQINSYVVLMLRRGEKFLTVERIRTPFFGYCGFLSMHIDKQMPILARAVKFLADNAIKARQIELSLIVEVLYKSVNTDTVAQHSLIYVVTGELEGNSFPETIDEGRLALLTEQELLAVEKGYSNTRDMIQLARSGNLSFVTREYTDSL